MTAFNRFMSEWKTKVGRGKIPPCQKERTPMETLSTVIDLMLLRLRLSFMLFYCNGATPEVIAEMSGCITELQSEIEKLQAAALVAHKFLKSFTSLRDAAELAHAVNERVWQRKGFNEYFVTSDPLMSHYFRTNPKLFTVVIEAIA